MPDYREISQSYAIEAIEAAMLVNGGAAIALVTQLGNPNIQESLRWALLSWSAGVALGAMTWLVAFMSTRYVDKHEREQNPSHLTTSNIYMISGLALIFFSLIFFVAGVVIIAFSGDF